MTIDIDNRRRLLAGIISLSVGGLIMVGKFTAYAMTGSAAIFSDALESIVNVLAATFAIGSILFAGKPADREHPYGHGKIEFFSAAFEGGLIAFAALLIAYTAVASLVQGPELRRLDTGLVITAVAGVANLGLGLFLLLMGRRTGSLILTADGQHVLSDFWTSLGVIVGLVLVRVTGIVWLDPVVAIVVALQLARTGFLLVRHAARALLDEEDTQLLERILHAAERVRTPGIIRLHHLRAIRYGRAAHVDAHLVVPEFWSVEKAHGESDRFEARLLETCKVDGEIVFHIDPCLRYYCGFCDLPECPVREAAFAGRPALTLDEATLPDSEPGKPPPLPQPLSG